MFIHHYVSSANDAKLDFMCVFIWDERNGSAKLSGAGRLKETAGASTHTHADKAWEGSELKL